MAPGRSTRSAGHASPSRSRSCSSSEVIASAAGRLATGRRGLGTGLDAFDWLVFSSVSYGAPLPLGSTEAVAHRTGWTGWSWVAGAGTADGRPATGWRWTLCRTVSGRGVGQSVGTRGHWQAVPAGPGQPWLRGSGQQLGGRLLVEIVVYSRWDVEEPDPAMAALLHWGGSIGIYAARSR